VDKEEADDTIKEAWEFSGVLDDSSDWCDFDTMLFSPDKINCVRVIPTSTNRIQSKQKDGKRGFHRQNNIKYIKQLVREDSITVTYTVIGVDRHNKPQGPFGRES
jgi:hypothetical protein